VRTDARGRAPNWPGPTPSRPSPEIASLVNRIKELVAERNRLERSASSERLERYRVEIARLQGRLAFIVQRELAH
jgi:hypothetical protein